MHMRYFVKLMYDGTAYHGWQLQTNAVSVQELLQKSFSLILRQTIELYGCGRTDTGVHAREYYAHFEVEEKISSLENILYKMNSLLPHDIVILNIQEVANDVHARFSAIRRTYKYYISQKRDPFAFNFEYFFSQQLDLDLMNTACGVMMSYKDFSCFSKSNTQVNNYICDISEAVWTLEGGKLVFTISANRFLRNMVRAIVGTMLEIGLGKINLNEFRQIISHGNRSDAGASVPAKGLFLVRVTYPDGDEIV